MADKLEKLKGMAELAGMFGATPEAEMRNRLLEQQIQAGREQTQAMRHQTQGGMLRSLMDMQKVQSDMQLNPLRKEALGAEIAAHNQRVAASQGAEIRANEMHLLNKRGQEEIILGQKTQNANLIAEGKQKVLKSTAELTKLGFENKQLQAQLAEWEKNAPTRQLQREATDAQSTIARDNANALAIAQYVKDVGQGFPNLPEGMRSIIGTGLRSFDPLYGPNVWTSKTDRFPAPATWTPEEGTRRQLVNTQSIMNLRELLADPTGYKNLTPEQKMARQRLLQSIMDESVDIIKETEGDWERVRKGQETNK